MEGGAPSSKVCTFFKQGRCRFGDACRFAHPPGETEFSAPGDFPSLDDQGSAESSGSSRLGKWSKDEEMQEKGRAVEVRPPRYVHAGYPNQFYHLPPPPWRSRVRVPFQTGADDPGSAEQDFQDVYASLPSAAISIPGLSRSAREALSGSASPPDYGLSSSPQGISPEEEAALEDVRPRASHHALLSSTAIVRYFVAAASSRVRRERSLVRQCAALRRPLRRSLWASLSEAMTRQRTRWKQAAMG